MKTIRVLQVIFDTTLQKHEIPAFRGAVIDKVGHSHVMYHNHKDGNTFVYGYPMLQYKCIGKKPAIVCLGDAVDEIHHFFNAGTQELELSNRKLEMKIDKLNLQNYTVDVKQNMHNYFIKDWLPLNKENYLKYKNCESLIERVSLLERVLRGNILMFARKMDWNITEEVRVAITKIDKVNVESFKSIPLMAFNISFKTNVLLPPFIGLGKSVSMGHGTVYNNFN